jgi:uncharacterized protein DUF4197
MKNRITLLGLTASGLVALAAGCGKTENPPPPTTQADKAINPAKPEPVRAVEQPLAQTTNAVVATTDATKTKLDTRVKAAETAVTPVTEAATKSAGSSNPAPDKPQVGVSQAQNTLADLSHDQVVQGLKDALAKGLQQAIAGLGHDGGFLTNLNVKIPMPEKLQKVETTLRAMKQDKLADDFVTTMNHAAEQAVPAAGSVFVMP